MSYFLTQQILKVGEVVALEKEEARHIFLARRTKKGEKFLLQDVSGGRFEVEAEVVAKSLFQVRVLKSVPVPPEPVLKLDLFVGFPNEKALDFVLQKSTELGVGGVVLFNSQNVSNRLTREQYEKKRVRWEKILWEAAKQSDRSVVPGLSFCFSMEEVLSKLAMYPEVCFCDMKGKKANIKTQVRQMAVVVGPEGGFAPEETERLRSLPNCQAVKFSNFVLRAETAALTASAVILNSNF